MAPDSTDTESASEASLRGALFNQLLAGPTSAEVAAVLLRDALKQLYPDLDLDPYTTVVGEPAWEIVGSEIIARPTLYESLSDMLAAQMDQGQGPPTLLIEGLHFLTQLPITTPEVHLPVRIDQVGRLINELAPAMVPARQEQQLAYWNIPFGNYGPRWHQLSLTLRKLWDVKQVDGWTVAECDMARQLYLHPDRQDRKDAYDSHAYLIEIDAIADNQKSHVSDNSLVVLIGTIDKKEVILAHSLLSGYQKYESREALGKSLLANLSSLLRPNVLQWRLYEPGGNVFDSKACGIITTQVKVLGLLNIEQEQILAENEPPAAGLTHGPGEDWFRQQIPEWLQVAQVADQVLFAQYMKSLSALSNSHAGKTYLDGIASIKNYASNALKTQMQAEHADASTWVPENIEIEIKSPVVWGSFVVPFQLDTTRFNLVELALQNLIAVPSGNKTIRAIDGTELPSWMTVAYVENLITKIDIGRVYPELIKHKLLDDPAESTLRESLYISQLRIQLPMIALEGKLRGQGDIDDRGCRYVAALMEPLETDRKVDGQPIVLRKLAFVPELQLGVSEDIVANMFVIGTQTASAGPCLLYRPLLEPQLLQFPSFSNLLYAIKQNADLRQSVLAWLPDGVRDNYSRYVFPNTMPSPWAVVDFVANPLMSLANSGPVTLSDDALGDDFMSLLFKANANALVTLADRQSVSNSESRWESFKQAGWLIFNLALPYLGTTANTTIWLWQILNDLEQLTQNDGATQGQAKWETFVDLLLNVALGVINIAIDRTKTSRRSRPTDAPEVVPAKTQPGPKPEPVIKALTPLIQTELPQEHYDDVHTSGALMGKAGKDATLLGSFSVNAPDVTQPEREGPLKGLYQKEEKWYANIADKWFEVSIAGEQVNIIEGERTGPPLTRNAHGQWHVDSRLRLRGSGSKGARQKVVVNAQRRSIQLLAELRTFEQQKPLNERMLTMEAKAMALTSPADRETQANTYLATLREQRENYEKALKALVEWPVFQSRPDYPQISIGYLGAQINFTFAEIDLLKERFTPVMAKAQGMITSLVRTSEQQHIDAANSMISIGDQMIERLDYLETRFTRLKQLGFGGFELVREHRKKLPVYTSDDLRLIQLDMYRHLCLSVESVATMPEGWAEINRLVDNATVAFQSLRDAIDERSAIRLDEKVDALGSLTEQFAAIQEHLDYMQREYQDSSVPLQLTRLRRRISDSKKLALRNLAQALDERSSQRRSGRPYEQRPRSRKKFIRTRFWGFVSGEPRLSSSREETGWLDVRNPLSNEIIATFHHKENGEWVPHVLPSIPATIPALAASVQKGKALIDGLAAFKKQIKTYTQDPHRTPAGIAMLMNAHASRMETVGVAIRKALDLAESVVTNETVELPQEEQRTAEALRLQLKKESKTLYAEEFETVLSIIKQSPPTMSGVVWLNDRNRIRISKRTNRERIRTPFKGYLDRYEIKDKGTGKTLWFADFHYSQYWVSDRAFLSARLRTAEQVNSGAIEVSTTGFSQRQLIDHYRSEIAVDQAQQVFFPKVRS